MFQFVTGNLLESDAYALVNTVNCEGYMGKGIAYQFKLRFPEMNKDYVEQCKAGKLIPGKLHCFPTKDKLIINFPTKDKWRKKSRMEYITSGLDELVRVIQEYAVPSIAIPALGSGNGGLIWHDVKQVILEKLKSVSETVDILIYEPSQSCKSSAEPQLSLSALLLMKMEFYLESDRFNPVGIQNTAYFMNILSDTECFRFRKGKSGPCDSAINVTMKNIRAFQQYHQVESVEEAYEILFQKLISQSVQEKLRFYDPFIEKAALFTNQMDTLQEVECAGTALYIIQKNPLIDLEKIITEFKSWSRAKTEPFSDAVIEGAVNALEDFGLIENTLAGYEIQSS